MIYDVIIIGAGPAGYAAGIKAAKKGLKVALIEKEKVGGTCLNWGCIPTKTYYRNAEFLKDLKESEKFGVTLSDFNFSMEKTYQRKEEVVGKLISGIEQLIKGNKIDYFSGMGSFKDKNTISIKGNKEEIIKGKNIIIATGSKTNLPPIKGIEHPEVLDSKSILNLQELPKDLLIIGGGVIGIEFAGIFNHFGTKVQVLEYMPEILVHEDKEVIKRFLPLLKKQGIGITTSIRVTEVIKNEDGFLIKGLNKKDEEVEFRSSTLLNAAGRVALTEGLNLEEVGIKTERGNIKINSKYETNIKGIFAIGDVNGKIQLAHAASHQGIIVAEYLKDPEIIFHDPLMPSCTFTFPEISSIGLTEEKAKEKGLNYRTNKFLFVANGKALAKGDTDGFVKVIIDENNKIIGVHILGPHASDLIHEAAVAMSKNMGVEDIAKIVHAHPTLAEAFDEAVLGTIGEAIHQI